MGCANSKSLSRVEDSIRVALRKNKNSCKTTSKITNFENDKNNDNTNKNMKCSLNQFLVKKQQEPLETKNQGDTITTLKHDDTFEGEGMKNE
mmetsp:Transcript_17294/g.24978  ORF Transcript_17294/g.24978 Transcript_17294/m.24978 type:complete len:92 (+) Transcript_17294:299-574(+)